MNVLDAALLGVVQGLTEFLPVSSSGHLILARAFFGWDAGRYGLAFDVACHVGTLLAVWRIFTAISWRWLARAVGALTFRDGEAERLVRLIAVGTLPVVVVALVFGDVLEGVARPGSCRGHAGGWGRRAVDGRALGTHSRDENTIQYWEACAWRRPGGGARSGRVALGRHADGRPASRTQAARGRAVCFSHEPAGGSCRGGEGDAGRVDAGAADFPALLFVVGLVVSAIVGYLTIKFFLRYLANHSLTAFAYLPLRACGR